MRFYFIVLSLVFILFTIITSCKKRNDNSVYDCFPDAPVVRQITNEKASVKKADAEFFIVEQGSIDTKLNPCNLPAEFQFNNLEVTISGDVKQQTQLSICCVENFVITKITR